MAGLLCRYRVRGVSESARSEETAGSHTVLWLHYSLELDQLTPVLQPRLFLRIRNKERDKEGERKRDQITFTRFYFFLLPGTFFNW